MCHLVNWNQENAEFRKIVMACGIESLLMSEVSSPCSLFHIQCELFSIDQCPISKESKCTVDASKGFRLLLP